MEDMAALGPKATSKECISYTAAVLNSCQSMSLPKTEKHQAISSSTIMSFRLSTLLSLLTFLALSLKSNADNHIAMVTSETKSAGQIAIYWGRDNREGTLEETCSTNNYQIVIIAFLSNFGGGKTPELILDTRCNPQNNGCQELTNDIRACQELGVKVFLSIGGPPGSYSLGSNDDGTEFGDYLWNTFLGGSSNSRPFGAAALDGVDFDIRGGGLFYTSVTEKLSEYNKQSKKVYISASVPCLYPPKRMAGTISSGLLDYVWVQFNNVYGDKNSCEYNPNDIGPFKAAWKYWTSQKNIQKVFFGALAWVEAGVSGYIEKEEFESRVLPYIKASPKYGGVAIWNRYYDLQNKYSDAIKAQV